MDTSDKILLLILGAIAGGIIIGGIILLRGTASGALNARSYTNDEEWEIVRDAKTGRTQGVRVKRTAKESN